MTALSAAFERAGYKHRYSRAEMEAFPAVQKFRDQGGSREAWIALYDRDVQLRGAGRGPVASIGQACSANPSQPLSDGGQMARASNGHDWSAPVANPIPHAGQGQGAENGQSGIAGVGNHLGVEGQASIASNGHCPRALDTSPDSSAGHVDCASDGQKEDAGAATPLRETPAKSRAPMRANGHVPVSREPTAQARAAVTMIGNQMIYSAYGIDWSKVTYRELHIIARQGGVAKEIIRYLGEVPAELHGEAIPDLIRPNEFVTIIQRVRYSNE